MSVSYNAKAVTARLQEAEGVQKVLTAALDLFQAKGFLPAALCAELITLIDAHRRPSTIADANGDPTFRTSETCDLPMDSAPVMALEERLYALNGIDPVYGEPVQGQRYAVGQEFKAHTDYFNPEGEDFVRYCTVGGQRTWTFMVYLDDVEAGGATRFPAIKKTFRPEAGKLLCWNSQTADGIVNPATIHHGMKVRAGTKYVITKWYREQPFY